MLRRPSTLFFAVTALLDTAGAAGAWLAASWLAGGPFAGWFGPVSKSDMILMLPVAVACGLIALSAVGLYRPARTRYLMRECMRATKAALLSWIALLAVLLLSGKTAYRREFLLLYWVCGTLFLVGDRFLLHRILRAFARRGIGLRRAAIVGVGELGHQTLARLRSNPWVGLKVEYFIDADPAQAEWNEGETFHGVPVAYRGEDFLPVLERNPVDAVLVAVPAHRSERLNAVLRSLSRLPVSVAVMPDFTGALRISASVGEFEGLPIVELWDTPIYGWYAVAKRVIDIAVSAACLILFGWLMLLLAILVKLTSPGPVLFKQERMGLGGKPFTILKFRTMRVASDEESDTRWTTPQDERITPVGRFMRRFSLDELPQFFNVLKGDMSLVGPRPERPYFVKRFTEELPAYMLRHSVKAGMTGWAQINGLRGDTSIEERLQYDLYYINNWSLQFDLFILLVTPFAGLLARNAY